MFKFCLSFLIFTPATWDTLFSFYLSIQFYYKEIIIEVQNIGDSLHTDNIIINLQIQIKHSENKIIFDLWTAHPNCLMRWCSMEIFQQVHWSCSLTLQTFVCKISIIWFELLYKYSCKFNDLLAPKLYLLY